MKQLRYRFNRIKSTVYSLQLKSSNLMAAMFALLVSPTLAEMVWCRSSAALLSRTPVSLALIVNRVTASSVVDLPPLNQQPTLYADLELDGESLRTSVVETPQIGASVYPAWGIYVDKIIWLEQGHPIDAAIRVFDVDEDDAHDKIILTSLGFDPIACNVMIGNTQIEGDRAGSACSVVISNLQGENGKAKITLTADW